MVAKKKTEILGPSTFDSEKLVLNFPANFVRLSAAHNNARIAFYGRTFAEAILLTNYYYASEATRLMEPRSSKLTQIEHLFDDAQKQHKAPRLTYQGTPDSSLLEGVITIGQALEVLTRNEIKTSEGAKTGLTLHEILREIAQSDVIVRLAAKMRFSIVAPAALGKLGSAELQDRASQSSIRIGPAKFVWPKYLDKLNKEEQDEVDRLGADHGTEVGCPVAMIGKSVSSLLPSKRDDSERPRSSTLAILVDRYIENLILIHSLLEGEQIKRD